LPSIGSLLRIGGPAVSINPLSTDDYKQYPYIGSYATTLSGYATVDFDVYHDNLFTAISGSDVKVTAGAMLLDDYQAKETKSLYLRIDNSARCKENVIHGIKEIVRVDVTTTGADNNAVYTFSTGAPPIRNAGSPLNFNPASANGRLFNPAGSSNEKFLANFGTRDDILSGPNPIPACSTRVLAFRIEFLTKEIRDAFVAAATGAGNDHASKMLDVRLYPADNLYE
jgi:hypothetical protein